MSLNETILNKQEQKWILERRVTRLWDNKEVQIYPMGAERYLSSSLFGARTERYNIRAQIEKKDLLVIPAHGTSSFLFVLAGANSVTAYDKDPITIAWMKAFKKYYTYREYNSSGSPYPSVGELMTALTDWYPPLLSLPEGKYSNPLFWILHPNSLRRRYIHYMVSLVQDAIRNAPKDNFELDKKIQFHCGTVDKITMSVEKKVFDAAFVPYLLGVENGIEKEKDTVYFMEQLINLVPEGPILVTPSRGHKEFGIMGKRYFVTTGYSSIQEISGLKAHFLEEDTFWFRNQGIAVFGRF